MSVRQTLQNILYTVFPFSRKLLLLPQWQGDRIQIVVDQLRPQEYLMATA